MIADADDGGMTAVLILLLLVAIGPLAVFFGADSRRQSDRQSI
jgi:hypothetical protein